MAGKIFLANVGVNASHRFSSPIFPDGTFEFIPIPEDRQLRGPHVVRYRDLRSYNAPETDLRAYVPERLWSWPTHNDPEFETYTYGDQCEISPRGASLKQLETGDFLFFLAHLARWRGGKSTGDHGFYLIGYLEVEEVLRDVRARPGDGVLRRFGANGHVRRGLCNSALWDRFWVFKGSPRSRRFRLAVPVTRELAGRVFTAADGSPWQWDGGRTELQVIGSYTRSCRCVLDPSIGGHRRRITALWRWIEQHAGGPHPFSWLRAGSDLPPREEGGIFSPPPAGED